MCGIYVSISSQSVLTPSPSLKELLCNRGPDYTGEAVGQIVKNRVTYYLSFISTVLALRGDNITQQPFVHPQTGSILCWNGEAWKIGSKAITGNDGQVIFDALVESISAQDSEIQSTEKVTAVLKSISGPFAFVFYSQSLQQVYFGRDRLGRRSLLYNIGPDSVEFSSVEDPARGIWNEVEADAVYMLSGSQNTQHPDNVVDRWSILPRFKYSWDVNEKAFMPKLGHFNRDIPSKERNLFVGSESVKRLHHHLCESLKHRILNIPVPPGSSDENNVRIAILFSGGLDCTVLARIAHDILPSGCQVDLLNVAFENPRVIRAAKSAFNPKRQLNEGFEATSEEESLRLAHDEGTINYESFESCPDRQTGRKALQELNKTCPTRIWRFVAINIPYAETLAHRKEVIRLMHPHNTEMDLSIACALYFASRGTGIASSNIGDRLILTYTTPARVLLSGLGADELFGGYTRHSVAFNRRGYPGLCDELELDVNRLGKRNLGRDDRVISHWGREARFPYLDESLVRWAVESPVWDKCGFQPVPAADKGDLEMEPGKKVLRLLAYDMGLHSVAYEKKRAIQFGARTAKMEVGRTKGTSIIR